MKIDNVNLEKVKKVFSGVMLVVTAITAFADVFDKDRKDKEFEAMKKAIADLQSKKD